jgi:hypothetical protein
MAHHLLISNPEFAAELRRVLVSPFDMPDPQPSP